jgi:hypothetical protein
MSNRNDYRTWTPAEIEADILATWDRMEINGVPVRNLIDSETGKPLPLRRLTYDLAKGRLGLRVVFADVQYELDAEGNPILNEKGKPIVASTSVPAYKMKINVKVEGLTDSYGTPIPKGTQYFCIDRQVANRPFNESNCDALLARFSHWTLNGETLIKDSEGGGQNEQHRCGAVVKATLTGAYLPPEGIPCITIDGVSRGAAGSIDTGKQKSTTDDFGSDEELLPFPLTCQDYLHGTTIGFPDATLFRTRILNDAQGSAKRIILRMLGKNIKASLFDGYTSGGNAMTLAKKWVGFDHLCNMSYAFVEAIPLKDSATKSYQRPVKTWEVTVAYACWLLRNSEQLQGVASLGEYSYPSIDLDPLKEFLIDLQSGAQQGNGPLADWCADRVKDTVRKHSDEMSFAQVLIAMREYFAGNPVTSEINRATVTGKDKQSGSVFTFLGGGDRGPIKKEKKAKD